MAVEFIQTPRPRPRTQDMADLCAAEECARQQHRALVVDAWLVDLIEQSRRSRLLAAPPDVDIAALRAEVLALRDEMSRRQRRARLMAVPLVHLQSGPQR